MSHRKNVLAKHTEKYGLKDSTLLSDLADIMKPEDHHELLMAMKYPNGKLRPVPSNLRSTIPVYDGGDVCECGEINCPDEYDHCTHGF